MKMRLIVCLSFLVLISLMPLKALVAQHVIDTLEQVKQLRDNKKLHAAMRLLEPYYAAHPTNLNTAWIYAQTAFWAKRYGLSQEVYEIAIWYHPENLYLQLDYAKMLVDIGKYEKAMPYLQNYLVYYPDDPQVRLAFTKMAFWKGRYKEAYNNASEMVTADPADTEAGSLLDEILLAKSPWIGLNGSFYTDNQPLQTIVPVLESGIYLHPLSTLRFRIRMPFFEQQGKVTNALWIQAGNSAFIRKGGWKINADAGFLKYPYKNTTTWTGNLELEKRSFRHFVLAAQAERKPYFATGSSVDTVINENHLAGAIGWDNRNSWNGKILFNLDYFLADKNYIYSLGAWIFAPPLKTSVFDFRLGYGFSYSTAEENRFEPVGIYYPYFTPCDQAIHSALISIGIHPAKVFNLGVSGNLGFYASAQYPYFYLDTNGNGSYVVKKGYSKVNYFPYNINAYALVQISKKISLRAEYVYSSTYFYISNYAGLQLKISIWNAKKWK
ncbi:MAG: hypothetical protein V1733_04360 [bacterium]